MHASIQSLPTTNALYEFLFYKGMNVDVHFEHKILQSLCPGKTSRCADLGLPSPDPRGCCPASKTQKKSIRMSTHRLCEEPQELIVSHGSAGDDDVKGRLARIILHVDVGTTPDEQLRN